MITFENLRMRFIFEKKKRKKKPTTNKQAIDNMLEPAAKYLFLFLLIREINHYIEKKYFKQ